MPMLRPALFFLLATCALSAKIYEKTSQAGGITVRYKIALPQDYSPDKTYPTVLAFPPGSQDGQMVQFTMMQNWWPQVDRRGYIVVIPEAPDGRMFVGEGARIFPEFLEQLLGEYKIRDRKFHIAGMSNGGRSAFHIAAMYPQYFLSVTGLPGYLPDATPDRVEALAKLCMFMHAGELDSEWVSRMQQQADEFRAKGYSVEFTVEKGEGHVMSTLAGARSARLYDEIEQSRQGCGK